MNNGTYYCGVCNKHYNTIEERNACEAKCLKELKEAEEALKKQRLEDEKQERKDQIEAQYKTLQRLVNEYIKDYGSIHLTSSNDNDSFPFLTKMLGRWYF